mgnify:CR=1 FL=1
MALVIEDGTGENPDAESYLSVSEADTLIDSFNFSDSWSTLTTAEKESFLKQGTITFDELMRWEGGLLNPDIQPLAWPRDGVTDNEGRDVKGLTGLLKRSVAQLTAAISEGKTQKEPIFLESQSWGDSSETYSKPIKVEDSIFSEVSLRLKRAKYGNSSSSIVNIERA